LGVSILSDAMGIWRFSAVSAPVSTLGASCPALLTSAGHAQVFVVSES